MLGKTTRIKKLSNRSFPSKTDVLDSYRRNQESQRRKPTLNECQFDLFRKEVGILKVKIYKKQQNARIRIVLSQTTYPFAVFYNNSLDNDDWLSIGLVHSLANQKNNMFFDAHTNKIRVLKRVESRQTEKGYFKKIFFKKE